MELSLKIWSTNNCRILLRNFEETTRLINCGRIDMGFRVNMCFYLKNFCTLFYFITNNMALKLLLIRIRQWLEENPQVWRYLCCASAVVGLLCFALSSYLHILFRHWSLLKIILYCVASAGICVALWFAKDLTNQEGSTTRPFHAYIKVFTLIAGCIISNIINKVLNKKPDSYGLTSCAAFAVMSFSLSRRADYGFEVEMESFFMGILLGQLYLIKWWYLSAGGGFWCLLTTLRSFLDAHHLLPIQVGSEQSNTSGPLLIVPQQPNSSTDGILQEFQYTLRILDEGKREVFDVLIHHLAQYLIDEDEHQIPSALVNDPNILMDQVPLEAINLFGESHEKVRLMIAGGLENQCSNEYIICRRVNLKSICKNLWERMGSGWWTLQSFLEKNIDIFDQRHMIKSWIKLSNICIRVLFPYEKRLCDRVFSGFSSVSDISFTQVCSEMASLILNFAKVWADVRYSCPLNNTVLVFDTLHGLIPEFELVFCDDFSAPLRNEATSIRNALGGKICHDIEQESVLGGIHPITVKVMDSVLNIRDVMSFLSVDMTRIIKLLEIHLENRSKRYPSNALGCVFLMNNQRYVVLKVQGSQLGATFGHNWIQQMEKVRKHLEHYQRSSWDEVFGILNEELNMTAKSRIEKLESFNKHFKQIRKHQCTWFIIKELKEDIRKSLETILLPAYGPFRGRLYNYIRFSVHELGDLLKDLFSGREN